jgi:hypothetical protein
MTNPIIPSRNPAQEGQLAGMLRLALRKTMEATDGQLPAKVVSYNRATNKALVEPLISMVTTGGQQIPRAQIASVPVLALGGGGYCLTFPLQAGDTGWIEASDRDISLFIQSLQQAKPNTFRIHSFEDGRFIPDAFAKYTVAGEDSANMTIQSLDGTVKIALGPGVVNVKSSGTVNVTSTGKTTVTASEVDLVGGGGTQKGIVQADCMCAFTGAPHPMISATVKGTL